MNCRIDENIRLVEDCLKQLAQKLRATVDNDGRLKFELNVKCRHPIKFNVYYNSHYIVVRSFCPAIQRKFDPSFPQLMNDLTLACVNCRFIYTESSGEPTGFYIFDSLPLRQEVSRDYVFQYITRRIMAHDAAWAMIGDKLGVAPPFKLSFDYIKKLLTSKSCGYKVEDGSVFYRRTPNSNYGYTVIYRYSVEGERLVVMSMSTMPSDRVTQSVIDAVKNEMGLLALNSGNVVLAYRETITERPDDDKLYQRICYFESRLLDAWILIAKKAGISLNPVFLTKSMLERATMYNKPDFYFKDSDGDIYYDRKPDDKIGYNVRYYYDVSTDGRSLLVYGSCGSMPYSRNGVSQSTLSAVANETETRPSVNSKGTIFFNSDEEFESELSVEQLYAQVCKAEAKILYAWVQLCYKLGIPFFPQPEPKPQPQPRTQPAAQARPAARTQVEVHRIDYYDIEGDKTVYDIKKEFNDKFPYLRLGMYTNTDNKRANKSGGTISNLDGERTFDRIPSCRHYGRVEVYTNTTPEKLEKEFKRVTGLEVKVCYTDSDEDRFYISNDSSYYKMTLTDLNEKFEDLGYYYNDWK